jgi:hypothetical protein
MNFGIRVFTSSIVSYGGYAPLGSLLMLSVSYARLHHALG